MAKYDFDIQWIVDSAINDSLSREIISIGADIETRVKDLSKTFEHFERSVASGVKELNHLAKEIRDGGVKASDLQSHVDRAYDARMTVSASFKKLTAAFSADKKEIEEFATTSVADLSKFNYLAEMRIKTMSVSSSAGPKLKEPSSKDQEKKIDLLYKRADSFVEHIKDLIALAKRNLDDFDQRQKSMQIQDLDVSATMKAIRAKTEIFRKDVTELAAKAGNLIEKMKESVDIFQNKLQRLVELGNDAVKKVTAIAESEMKESSKSSSDIRSSARKKDSSRTRPMSEDEINEILNDEARLKDAVPSKAQLAVIKRYKDARKLNIKELREILVTWNKVADTLEAMLNSQQLLKLGVSDPTVKNIATAIGKIQKCKPGFDEVIHELSTGRRIGSLKVHGYRDFTSACDAIRDALK